LNFQDIYQLYT